MFDVVMQLLGLAVAVVGLAVSVWSVRMSRKANSLRHKGPLLIDRRKVVVDNRTVVLDRRTVSIHQSPAAVAVDEQGDPFGTAILWAVVGLAAVGFFAAHRSYFMFGATIAVALALVSQVIALLVDRRRGDEARVSLARATATTASLGALIWIWLASPTYGDHSGNERHSLTESIGRLQESGGQTVWCVLGEAAAAVAFVGGAFWLVLRRIVEAYEELQSAGRTTWLGRAVLLRMAPSRRDLASEVRRAVFVTAIPMLLLYAPLLIGLLATWEVRSLGATS